jgi:hypothetical protein
MILEGFSMAPAGLFSAENAVFELHREEWWRSHPGAYVAIQGDNIADGFFATYAEALKAALQRFDIRRDFLIKQVWETEPVYFVS